MHNWEHYGRLPAYFLVATLVASCGGGGGSDLISLNGQSAATIKTDVPNTAFAGLETSTFVSLTLTDENGRPLVSTPVTLAISGTAKLSATSDVTNEKGVVTFAITGNKLAEKGTVVATYTDSAKNIARETVNYEIVDGSKGVSLYTITRSNTENIVIPTSGQTLTPISMTLKDGSNRLAADGQVVEFSLLPVGAEGVGRLVAASAKTVNGVITAQVDGLNQKAGDNVLIATYVDSLGSRVSQSIPFKIVNEFEILLTAPSTELRTGEDSVTLTATVFSASQSLVKNAKVSFRVLDNEPKLTEPNNCSTVLTDTKEFESVKLDKALRGTLTQNDILTDEFGQASTTFKVSDNHNSHRRIVVTVDDKALGENKPFHCLNFNLSGTKITIDPVDLNTSRDQENSISLTVKNGRGFGIKGVPITLAGAGIESALVDKKIANPVSTNEAGTFRLDGMKFTTAGDIIAQSDDYAPSAISNVTLSAEGQEVSFVDEQDKLISSASISAQNIFVKIKVPLPLKTSPIVKFATTLGTIHDKESTYDPDLSDGFAKARVSTDRPGTVRVDIAELGGKSNILGHGEFRFISAIPSKINLQADQSTLSPKGQTFITAEALDKNDNPVEGAIVEFIRQKDQSNGSLSAALVKTDENGRASVSFTAGSGDTAKDAVEISAMIKAKVGANTVDVDTNTILPNKNVKLTVGGQALFISIATGSTLLVIDPTTYAMPLSVAITDAVGHPVSGKNVSIQVIPTRFIKGRYKFNAVDRWHPVGPSDPNDVNDFLLTRDLFRSDPVGCANEDANLNGILDLGEDSNGDGILTPGNPVTVVGDLITNAAGRSAFQIQYGKSFASWLEVKVIASAEVSGSESRTQRVFTLPVLAEDVSTSSILPPGGGVSEYGLPSSIVVQDSSGDTLTLLSEYKGTVDVTYPDGTVVKKITNPSDPQGPLINNIASCNLKKEEAPLYYLKQK